MRERTLDIVYPVVLWVGSFAWMLWYSLNQYTLASDSLVSYNCYLQALEGGWSSVTDSLAKASLSTTLLPATVQQALHTDPLTTFKSYSSFILPFLPVVVYLITRRFWSSTVSFLATGVILGSQLMFLRLPAYSQVGISVLLFALIVLVILGKSRWKHFWVTLLAVAVVLAHYSVAYMSIALLGGATIVSLILKYHRVEVKLLPYLVTATVSMTVAAVVWTGFVATGPSGALLRVLQQPSTEARAYAVEKRVADMVGTSSGSKFYSAMLVAMRDVDVREIPKRDPVVEQALGKGLGEAPLLSKAKWLVGWAGILALCAGYMIMTLRRRRYGVPAEFLVLSAGCFIWLLLWAVIPYISLDYGIGRVYFQSSVILVVSLGVLAQTTSITRRNR